MKNKYSNQLIDLRHQVDSKTPERIQLFEQLKTDPANVNVRIFNKLVRHRQIEMISDRKKI